MQPLQPITRDEARDHAIEWQHWYSEQDLYMSETIMWQAHFTTIALKFDLVEEFKENGII